MVHDYSENGKTLVMATKATIQSEKFNCLYNKYDNGETILLQCEGLADKIENGSKEEIYQQLEKLLGAYKNKVENVVLGCTHYPLVQEQIKEILGDDVMFFNGAHNLAIHLQEVLKTSKLLGENEGKIEFIDTQNSKIKKERFYNYLK